MRVPFVDLKAQYNSIRSEIDPAIANIIENTQFVGGEVVRGFERQFADYISISHCVSCANGTDAIEIALQALGIEEGDEVLVPAMSWIATSEAVSTAGAAPVFVDIHPDYFTIDPGKIEEKITERTKAIIPVHLYGLPCEMDEIKVIARKHNLIIIEDCAQAHGATYKNQKVGTMGDVATFSFYPGKNLGAYGDAGCIVTNTDPLAEKCRMIANHGQQGKHNHMMEGRNSRMDTLQAAVLLAKLPHLDQWNSQRQVLANSYSAQLQKAGIKIQNVPEHSKAVFHVFSVLLDDRDAIKTRLGEMGISTQIHYPHALSIMPAYAHLGYKKEDFPVAVSLGNSELSLPLYPELSEEQLAFVIKQLLSLT